MARKRRFTIPHASYHVMVRGNNKMPIFKDNNDRAAFLEILRNNKEKFHFKLFHYALMENHVHLILHFENGPDLSAAMKRINIMYVQHYRRKYRGIGHFFQDRFKSFAIQDCPYMMECGRYVELNPVRSGIVKRPEEAVWTSYHAYLGKQDDLVDFGPEYMALSDNPEKRIALYTHYVNEKFTERRSLSRYFKEGVCGSKAYSDYLVAWKNLVRIWSHPGRPRYLNAIPI